MILLALSLDPDKIDFMEMDEELVEVFIEEITELKGELEAIVAKLQGSVARPESFTHYAQIIDRIYGTATTMGFIEIGNYLGEVRNICRQCGSSNIPRAFPEVFKIIRSCTENIDDMKSSLTCESQLKLFLGKIRVDLLKVNKINEDIFKFSSDAKTSI